MTAFDIIANRLTAAVSALALSLVLVTGTMTTLLEEQPYNAETGEGFGCYSCHQM